MTSVSRLSFVQYLSQRLRDTPPAKKGARTRERIVIATAQMLETHGYHAMRVVDITECAGISEGAFYVYFADKKDASLTTLSAFIVDFVDAVAPVEAVHAPMDSIRVANRRWFELCRANRGLMRCIFQVGDQDADFARLIQRTTRRWYEGVAQNLQVDGRHADNKSTLLAIYFIGSMMDEIVRKLIVFPDPEFHELIETWDADDMAIADAASLLWIRIFDLDAVPPDDLEPAAEALADFIWPQARNT